MIQPPNSTQTTKRECGEALFVWSAALAVNCVEGSPMRQTIAQGNAGLIAGSAWAPFVAIRNEVIE